MCKMKSMERDMNSCCYTGTPHNGLHQRPPLHRRHPLRCAPQRLQVPRPRVEWAGPAILWASLELLVASLELIGTSLELLGASLELRGAALELLGAPRPRRCALCASSDAEHRGAHEVLRRLPVHEFGHCVWRAICRVLENPLHGLSEKSSPPLAQTHLRGFDPMPC